MANPRFVIKAVISGQRLNINIPLTVAGTLNYIGVEAKCTSEWNDCTVTCYIMNAAGNLLRLALTYDRERDIYFFPASELLTLGAGEWSIYFVGVQVNNGEISYRVTTEPRTFTIAYNILYSDVPPEQIPIYEQAIAIANDAKNTADELYQMYLDGDLKGDKGDAGDPARIGFVQASVDNTTNNPRCTVTVTENPANTYSMQFDFYGIKGEKGDTGATGPKGDTGAQGTPGRDGTDGVDGETIDDYVLVQAEQPTSETNKMWLKPTASTPPVMIPTVEDVADLKSAIAPVETSYTATRNYAIGSYLFVGTNFYKVIAAIQTGGTITVDTNVEQTTVDEQLRRLEQLETLQILKQPQDYFGSVGDNATFEVIATGIEPLSYVWEYSTDLELWVTAGAGFGMNTNVYSVEITDARLQNANYRCRITDGNGKILLSDAVKLYNIANGPIIIHQPESFIGRVNTYADFHVAAIGAFPLSYQWQFKAPESSEWGNVGAGVGYTTGSFTIQAKASRNGISYRCKITDSYNVSVFSDVATITLE